MRAPRSHCSICVNPPHLLSQPAEMELPEVLAIEKHLQGQGPLSKFQCLQTGGSSAHVQLQSRRSTFPWNCMRGGM